MARRTILRVVLSVDYINKDINDLGVAFYKGDERKRTFAVEVYDTNWDDEEFEFTSSGSTEAAEYYSLDSDETQYLCIEAEDLDNDEWFSVLEVRFMVDE